MTVPQYQKAYNHCATSGDIWMDRMPPCKNNKNNESNTECCYIYTHVESGFTCGNGGNDACNDTCIKTQGKTMGGWEVANGGGIQFDCHCACAPDVPGSNTTTLSILPGAHNSSMTGIQNAMDAALSDPAGLADAFDI